MVYNEPRILEGVKIQTAVNETAISTRFFKGVVTF